jgi:hypothetical protein
MNAQSFVKAKIDQLSQEYPHLKFRYEEDDFSKSHYVEYSPRIEENRRDWQTTILIIYREFYEAFKGKETLIFFEKDANLLLTITNPIYEKSGI